MTSEYLLSDPTVIRIVLIGKTGVGKTAVMNTISKSSKQNESALESQMGLLPETERCVKEELNVDGQKVLIVDTPGLFNADRENEEVMNEIKKSFSLAAPGPHIFLFVLNLETFTPQDQSMVELFWNTFGENAAQYTMVLFTNGNELKNEGKTIEGYIKEYTELKNFVDKCKGEYHVVDNSNQDPSQVAELLQKITNMVKQNGGKAYTLQNSEMKKKVALSVNGAALAGAGVGAATSHLIGSSFGIGLGAAAGAAVGGVMGGVGIVASEHIKAKQCVVQ